jgi:hypothetical protein
MSDIKAAKQVAFVWWERQLCNLCKRNITYTLKPVYVKHVDKWFLKLVLYYFNKNIFKNHLSTCLR